jgi:hypothetical protein
MITRQTPWLTLIDAPALPARSLPLALSLLLTGP